jgi:hypothetical protein
MISLTVSSAVMKKTCRLGMPMPSGADDNDNVTSWVMAAWDVSSVSAYRQNRPSAVSDARASDSVTGQQVPKSMWQSLIDHPKQGDAIVAAASPVLSTGLSHHPPWLLFPFPTAVLGKQTIAIRLHTESISFVD